MLAIDPQAAAVWLRLAFTIGTEVAELVMVAMRSGDTSTLDSLHGVLPIPSVLAARDEALRASQRERAAEALRRGKP